MSTINLGRILPMFKGTYNPEITYSKLDIVYYNGSSYVSMTTNKGYVPTNASRWQIIALKGSWATFTDEEKAEVIEYLTPILEELVDDVPFIVNSDNGDLDISDDAGKVLARFSDGHIKVKNFDSRNAVNQSQIDELNDSLNDRFGKVSDDIDTINGELEDIDSKIVHPVDVNDESDGDLDFADEDGNIIVRFSDGHIKTKNFDSSNITFEHPVKVDDSSNLDYAVADENGNIIFKIYNGHIYTKKFDSANSQGENNQSLEFLSRVNACNYEGNFMHISFDDTTNCITSLFSTKPNSIYDITFFNQLKNLHDTYGACFSLYVYVEGLSNVTNVYATEFQNAKKWLKWNFHTYNNRKYNTNSIITDYNLGIQRLLIMCDNDYECLDHQIRGNYWEMSETNAIYIKNHSQHSSYIFCAKDVFSPSEGNYYLNNEQKEFVKNNAKYYDLKNRIIFIQTCARLDSDDYCNQSKSLIENNIKWQKSCEVLNHEWGFNYTRMNNFLDWAKNTMNFRFGFFDEIYKFKY